MIQKYRNTIYIILVVFFFIAEVGAQLNIPFLTHIRATNQVLILLGLMFLPFLVSSVISLVQRLRVTVAGIEVDTEFREIKGKLKTIESEQFQLSGRMDNTQQVFLSILRGKDPSCEERINARKIKVGSKDFNEQKILSQILTRHIKESQIAECQCLMKNGGTIKNYFDLVNGWIDGYIEYTGTGCMLLDVEPSDNLDDVVMKLNATSKALGHGIVWLDPLGFTNNYVIVVKKDHLQNVNSISNLEHMAENLVFAGNVEFMNRIDGYPGLREKYRLNFKKEVICSYSDRYPLLKGEKADVVVGFETDPELNDKNLIVLEDPKKYFPEYYALPVFREDVLENSSMQGLKETINRLKEYQLDISKIRELNARFSEHSGTNMEVDFAEKIAKEFIK